MAPGLQDSDGTTENGVSHDDSSAATATDPLGLEAAGLRFLDWGPIDLSVGCGEVLGIAGESGSGKSLLLRALADLIEHEGSIACGGETAESMPASTWRARVGLLPASPQWWRETVGPHFRDPETVPWEAVGLEDSVVDWDIGRLSTGERQRLAVLRLLDHRPKALLLDEPTANLDETNTEHVERLILGYRRDHACPIVWVSHSDAQLLRVADQRLKMTDRRLRKTAEG